MNILQSFKTITLHSPHQELTTNIYIYPEHRLFTCHIASPFQLLECTCSCDAIEFLNILFPLYVSLTYTNSYTEQNFLRNFDTVTTLHSNVTFGVISDCQYKVHRNQLHYFVMTHRHKSEGCLFHNKTYSLTSCK